MHEINTLLRENNQVRQNVYIRIDLIKNKPIAASMHLVLVGYWKKKEIKFVLITKLTGALPQ